MKNDKTESANLSMRKQQLR